MAQYKASMARMLEKSNLSFDDVHEKHQDISGINSTTHGKIVSETPSFFRLMRNNDKLILYFLFPLLWCFGCVLLLDRNSFLGTLYMPVLGLFAAFLANCVPIGGGIVYIPAFALLGVQLKLGVSFTVATMTIGNGVFGLLRWLRKDESIIIWESFQYTVVPCGVGTLIAIFCLPTPSVPTVRLGFALFCLLLAVFVLLAVYRGGVTKIISMEPKNVRTETDKSIEKVESATGSDVIIEDVLPPQSCTATTTVPTVDSTTPHIVSFNGWCQVVAVSFLAGIILVPNIGIGPALTTYLMLTLVGYKVERALVTGIITGGWVCIIPFLLHIFYYDDVPYQLWIMVLPGVFFGAQYAPFVHEWIGLDNVMYAFACFLFATSILFAFH